MTGRRRLSRQNRLWRPARIGFALIWFVLTAAIAAAFPVGEARAADREGRTFYASRVAATDEAAWRSDAAFTAEREERIAAVAALSAVSAMLLGIGARPSSLARRRSRSRIRGLRVWSRRAARIARARRPGSLAQGGRGGVDVVYGGRETAPSGRGGGSGAERELQALRSRLASIRRLFEARPRSTLLDALSAAAAPQPDATLAVPLPIYLRELDRTRRMRDAERPSVSTEPSGAAGPAEEEKAYFETVLLDRLRSIGAFHREARIRRAIRREADG